MKTIFNFTFNRFAGLAFPCTFILLLCLRPFALCESALHEQTPEPKQRWTREWLESHGIIFQAGYRGELFTNLRGGMNSKREGEYLGSADSTLILDLAKLHLGLGAIVVSAQSLHGRGINDRKIGAVQTPSNLDNSSFNKLIETYFTDRFLHDRFTLKAGRLYADADFNVIEGGADFLNSSYGLIPTVPMPTYPAPAIGATLWSMITPRLSVGGGVYQGAKRELPEGVGESPTGLFMIAETKLEPFSKDAALHGSYRIGIWQQGKGAWARNDALTPASNYGLYATGDHWFRKSSSAGSNSGPGVFFQLGWAPTNRNVISSYWGVGTAYPGFHPQRPRDSIGLGITQACLSGGKPETVVELFYKVQATKKMFVQPDLQWVDRPAGEGHGGLLGGLRVGVEF